MKKITVDKEEGIAELIEQMLGVEDAEITFVVPKGSALARSVSNFHLLKREADSSDKTIFIESVDDTILAFAKASDLEGSHPLWRGVRGTGGGVSDIVPAGMNREEEADEGPEPSKKRRTKKKTESVKLTVEAEEEEEDAEVNVTTGGVAGSVAEEREELESRETEFFGGRRFFGKRDGRDEEEGPEEDRQDKEGGRERRISRRMIWIGAGVVALVFIVLAIITWAFGRVAITIDFKKTPWSTQGNFVADKSVSAIDPATDVIPAQVFTTQKNTTQLFPASGSANVSQRAEGTITVYNAYSSAPQELVATTRFVTPDGKIFRLVGGITVPGAQVTHGQITPSSITAPVVADKAGPAYNVGPVARLAIPGFQGTPKYNSFYGQLADGTSGGFTGTKAVPTPADIANAKAKVTAALQANLSSELTTSYPNNFKILGGATAVTVVKLAVSTSTDANGQFSVFGEATLQAIGFDEAAFKNFLLSEAGSTTASSTFTSITLTYTNVQANFAKGTLAFSVSGEGTIEPAFAASDFKAQIAGESIGATRDAIAALPQLADGRISVWPVWLWSVPKNPDKIQITAN